MSSGCWATLNPLDLVVVVQIDRRHGRRPAVDGRTPEAGMMDAADWPGRGPASAASRVPQASTRGWKHGQHMRSVDKLCTLQEQTPETTAETDDGPGRGTAAASGRCEGGQPVCFYIQAWDARVDASQPSACSERTSPTLPLQATRAMA